MIDIKMKTKQTNKKKNPKKNKTPGDSLFSLFRITPPGLKTKETLKKTVRN